MSAEALIFERVLAPPPLALVKEQALDITAEPVYDWHLYRRAELADMSMLPRLWYTLKYRVLNFPPPTPAALYGVFDTRAEAEAACGSVHDFIGRVPHGVVLTGVTGLEFRCHPLAEPEANAQAQAQFASERSRGELMRELIGLLSEMRAERR